MLSSKMEHGGTSQYSGHKQRQLKRPLVEIIRARTKTFQYFTEK